MWCDFVSDIKIRKIFSIEMKYYSRFELRTKTNKNTHSIEWNIGHQENVLWFFQGKLSKIEKEEKKNEILKAHNIK